MTAATWKQAALGILIAIPILGCKTPDGPRFPLPPQDVAAPIPDGQVRVVFFNTSNHLLYFESGPIRIQLDGNQIPSIWLDHYVQIYAQPGVHHLLLEHYDLFMWTSEYEVEFGEPEIFLEVYNNMVSTKYKLVDELPSNFPARFKPGRDPSNW